MSLTKTEIRQLKKRVAKANSAVGYWYQQLGMDVVEMTRGHVSARIPGTDLCLIKGRPDKYDFLICTDESYIVTLDINTNEKVDGEPDVPPVGEIDLHTCIYKARPDVLAVAHAHTDFCLLASFLGYELVPLCKLGLQQRVGQTHPLFKKPIPIFPDIRLISSHELGIEMAKALGESSAILLRNHGEVAVSSLGPEDAVSNIMFVEHQAKLNYYAFVALGKDYAKFRVPEEQRVALVEADARAREASQRPRRVLPPGQQQDGKVCEYNAMMAKRREKDAYYRP